MVAGLARTVLRSRQLTLRHICRSGVCQAPVTLPDVANSTTPDLVSSERDVLLHYLNKMRRAIVGSSESLNETQLRHRGVPSGTSILGVIYHLADVERHWFRLVFLSENIVCEMSMDVPPDMKPEEVITAYSTACSDSDRIVGEHPDLSTLATGTEPGRSRHHSLREILTHMIEETARHAGHVDILREQLVARA